jgi:chromosome segregation ATPase
MRLEVLESRLDKEIHMNAPSQDGQKAAYTTSHRIQAWFLHRSRENWKKKYGQLKVDAKRLQNRVNDVSKSREQWREESKELAQRVQELEAQNAALQEQLAALKKDG